MKWTFFLLILLTSVSCKFFDPDSLQRSRFGMGDLTLKLPDDAVKILDIDFAKDGKGQTTKYVTYIARDGEVYTREYRDGIFQMEGRIHWKGPASLFQ